MYNKVIQVGRMTRDIEVRHTQSGHTVGKFGLAVNTYRGKDKDDEVLFVDCTAFNKTAELISEHFSKGDAIMIEGRLQYNTWTAQDGTKRSKHEILVETFKFLPRTSDSSGGETKAAKDTDYEDIPF